MKVVPYYRVSTVGQGASGLGLEAQQAAVLQWAASNNAVVIDTPSYVEIESGRKSDRDRPVLAAALAHARAARATLVVAKLDRLARNVAFLSSLMEAGVHFVCVDNPSATPLTIHILAAVAEDEAKRISQRTRDALTAYRARGGLLGSRLPQCRNLTPAARKRGSRLGVAEKRRRMELDYAHIKPLIADLRRQGLSLRAVAEELNRRGYRTRTDRPWNQTQVMRLEDPQSQVAVVG